MDGMPRPRPPHLHRQVSRHGKPVWYVRIGKGPRIRIRSAFGTPEFDAEYQAAVAGLPALQSAKDDRTASGTLAWLVLSATARLAHGRPSRWQRDGSGRTSSSVSCNRLADSRSARSPRRPLWLAAIVASLHQTKPVTSSIRCAGYSVGPSRPA
jgi:hypothetical protein